LSKDKEKVKKPKALAVSKSTLQRRKQAQKGYIKFSNPRMEKFVSGLASGKGVVEAGLAAGYKENYCRTRLYAQMKTSNSFKELVKRHAKHSVELITNLYKINLLPRTFDVDEAMLQKMEEKPELGMKYPQVISRIHKVAGITEEVPAIQFVNIQTLNQLQVMQNAELEGLVDSKHDGDDIIEVSDD